MQIPYTKVTMAVCLLGSMLQSCKTSKPAAETLAPMAQTEAPSTAKALPEAVEGYTEIVPGTDKGFKMVYIPAGKFTMGSPETEANRKADEGPQKEVELDPFYMAQHELTWDLFELFFKQNKELFVKLENYKVMKIDAITRPSPPYEDPSYGMGKDGFPAVSMSAYSALVYCKWLSTVTGKFYRLPTEAEWEYAAKAGTQTAYSFGDDLAQLDDYAVYYKNSDGKYAKVGSKKPNPWGLYDMHGNAAEWTLDEYKGDAYATTDAKNPWVTPTVIHPRSYRGGSWDDDADKLRSSARSASSLKQQKRDPQIPKSFWWFTDSNYVGFRLVSPKNQPSPEEQKKFWQIVLDE
ncbi:formylglycine-generating enzyme family protein [Zobellia uliginosa]|uniref:formylglycine-generating enzyme family protein n=1 Tax=Zobellia uliginosa TaxID=143224 RepID=UPI0026E304CA|nr:formylglycine-generating enzyme family protein [Zobellia uliginosa]MDO6515590.1 formylglycine-generating enzyme family protein [Zobellia uliginosa]